MTDKASAWQLGGFPTGQVRRIEPEVPVGDRERETGSDGTVEGTGGTPGWVWWGTRARGAGGWEPGKHGVGRGEGTNFRRKGGWGWEPEDIVTGHQAAQWSSE